MKQVQVALGLILCFILFGETLNAQKISEQKIGNIYYLGIPSDWDRVYDINAMASAQYKKKDSESYTLIFDEDKTMMASYGLSYNNVEEYFESFINDASSSMEISDKKGSNIKVNKKNAYQGEFTSVVDEEVSLRYLITIIDTGDYYYKIISWATKDDFEGQIKTFKEIASSLKD